MSHAKAAFKSVDFQLPTDLTSPTTKATMSTTAAAAAAATAATETPPPLLRLSVSQSHTQPTLSLTLAALQRTAHRASAAGVDVLLFPEAYLGGYPRGAGFGARVGTRDEWGREQFLRYWRESVDLGDGPGGRAGAARDGERVMGGDGTREVLEGVARGSGVFLVVGVVERAGGTLYCAVVYVCPRLGVIGKRRKVMPTGTERLIWGQGQPSSLRAVTTTIRGVKLTLAAAICWENYMPLLRHSLYSQNVNLYLAPTADARDTWLSLMRTVACEGRCFVLSANQCVREKDLPDWIYSKTAEEGPRETEDRNIRQHRRRSVVTESGNEIALPADKGEDVEEAIIGGEEKTNDKLHRRKSSIVTEYGHEIVLPAVGEKQNLRRTVSGGEDNINGTQRPRKASFVTEAGHEIALPSDGSKYYASRAVGSEDENMNSTGHRRKESFATEDGHEIICPSINKGKSEKTVYGHRLQKTKSTEIKAGSAGSSEFACRGGSCIISPTGEVLAGPLWEKEDELLIVDVDFDDCLRGRLDLDVAGSYSRNDAFKLTVEGLDISPPL